MVETKYDYFEDSIDPDNRSLRQKVVVPSQTSFKGRRWDGQDKNDRRTKIDRSERIILTHTDADGYVSGALFNDYFEGDCEVITVDYEDIISTLNYILKGNNNVNEIYVSDLNLDEIPKDIIEGLVEIVNEFKWFDHHEWGHKKTELRKLGVDVEIDTDECGASIVHEYITSNDYNSNSKVKETVKLTKDHDLWEHEMETINIGGRSMCISKVFSQMAFYSHTNTFINEILDYGENFLDYEGRLLNGDNINPGDKNYRKPGYLSEKLKESVKKVNYVIENETVIENIKGYNIAFAYGRASPGDILEKLNEKREVDILVHTKPVYPVKVSFRSTNNFRKCHEIAEEFNGGGHEQAAGCKPGMFEEPLEWFEYLTEKGQPLENEVRNYLEEKL